MNEYFCIDNFFSVDEMNHFDHLIADHGVDYDFVSKAGPFAGKLIANFMDLTDHNEIQVLIRSKISTVLSKEFSLGKIYRTKLFFPWDIHSDHFVNECSGGQVPYYNFLIPLEDVESRTILFDQFTEDSPDFSTYKQSHAPVETPIDQTFWDENLSMCWPQDRQYLTIKHVMPWQKRGQLVGFPSKYFHSSDSFHLRFTQPKSFIQFRVGAMP
jgi:hypothetical protein